MRAQNEQSAPEELSHPARPIQLVTENGFSIVRRWEIDRTPPPATGGYRFVVSDPQGLEREVVVEIAEEVIRTIELRSRGKIFRGNSYWISFAERHLVAHLWETNQHPPDDRLLIETLDPEDIVSASRWKLS